MILYPSARFSTQRLILGLSAAVLCGEAYETRADVLTYYFSTASLDSSVAEYDGQSFDGSITFDTDSAINDKASITSFEFAIPAANAYWAGTGGAVRTYDSGGRRLQIRLDDFEGATYTLHPSNFLPTSTASISDLSIPTDNLVNSFPIQFSTTTNDTTHIQFYSAPDTFFSSPGDVTLTDVPEPSSAAMLGLGALALMRRKKQQG